MKGGYLPVSMSIRQRIYRLMAGLVENKSRFGAQQRELPFPDDEEITSTNEETTHFGDQRARQRENADRRTTGY